ncbi:MAG: hypothetical protein ABII02_01740 [Candidatus Magasanikbacteria bacterium]
MEFREFIEQQIVFLEKKYCTKHRLVHTGKYAYIIDLYEYVGRIDDAKKAVFDVLDSLFWDGNAWVFYPGNINMMNMSNNVIDSGAAIDCISRFLMKYSEVFSEKELDQVHNEIDLCAQTYLKKAHLQKVITNQRLWGNTGLASYSAYRGYDIKKPIANSIQKAFENTTADGLFIYYPDAEERGCPSSYTGPTTYYQSRHTAFIQYCMALCDIQSDSFQASIERSVEALVGLYTKKGYKDLTFESKRWYWLGKSEVVSHPFDIFALYHSSHRLKNVIINNAIVQLKKNSNEKKYQPHDGFFQLDHQCRHFWSAHTAWLTRIPEIEQIWRNAKQIMSYEYEYAGVDVFHKVNKHHDIHIHKFWGEKNVSTGILKNGIPKKFDTLYFAFKLLRPGKTQLFSIRETVNHAWYALRGGHLLECFYRLSWLSIGLITSLLPIYRISYGKVHDINKTKKSIEVSVTPATKYGALYKSKVHVFIPITKV